MRIVFLGTPQFAVPTLEALIAAPDLEVAAVVTQPDKPRGRGKQLLPSPVKASAIAHHLPVWQPRRLKKSPETLAQLRAVEADFFVVVAYGQILSPEILDLPRYGCINGHGSLLPQYRGAAPIQWCLYDGVTATGMTTMLMDAGMDTGAMLLKSQIPVGLFDNAYDLAAKLSLDCADLVLQTVRQFVEGKITPTPQDDRQATYARLITKTDYQLDWSRDAIALHNQIRAFYPYCVTSWRDQSLKILATIPWVPDCLEQFPGEIATRLPALDSVPTGEIGAVVGAIKKVGFVVQTGRDRLILQTAQAPGKKALTGSNLLNGLRLEIGDILG
jgi:methionyl-tRNA formyltransferase